jgi:hypothetical protein
MNEHRRFDEDDAQIDPVPQVAPAPRKAEQAGTVEASPAPAAPARRSWAGRLLMALVLLIAGAAAALIGGPRLAPLLPAPVAAWLAPAQAGLDTAALEQVRAALTAEITAARSEAEAARAEAGRALAAAERATTAAASAAAAAPSQTDDATATRLAELEAAVAGLGDAVLAAAQPDTTESDSAIAAFRAELAALDRRLADAPAFTAPADLADLRARLAVIEEALAQDVALRDRALAEAVDARRAAAVTAVLADIDRAMALGLPFPEAIEALRETTGMEPPAVLAEAATRGAPTREALQDTFAAAAHRAVAEALAGGVEGESNVAEVLARVQARFTGIPAEPIEGDTAPAVLSRARDALLHGRIEATLAEIATLPTPAQAAMADWIEGARLRDGADAALTSLRASIGRSY